MTIAEVTLRGIEARIIRPDGSAPNVDGHDASERAVGGHSADVPDAVLFSDESVSLARQELLSISEPGDVGEFIGVVPEDSPLASLVFACCRKGYTDWYWMATVSHVAEHSDVTVVETELLPSDRAILAPPWIPWAHRIEAADIRPSDVLPMVNDDPRLEQGLSAADENADTMEFFEIGLGRERVLSPEGYAETAERWYKGAHGPRDPYALYSRSKCSTCGFVVRLDGTLRRLFGACANEWSPFDGQVVSYDHGCPAHSESGQAEAFVSWPNRYEPDEVEFF
jgi:hypothetical protein